MLDQLKRMAVLAKVVEQGSFAGAARQLRISTSAVSQQVRALEQAMGVTLLHRTTRQLSLTPAGAEFHHGCAAMLQAAEAAQLQLQQGRDAPEGELRISAPVGFARHIGPALAPLLARHPRLSLHLRVEDSFTDLVAHRIDLAIRFGRLPDSPWVAQPLGAVAMALYAAPAYLARRGLPVHAADLATQDWLLLRDSCEDTTVLSLRQGTDPLTLRIQPRATSNNQLSLQQLCEAGLGLALLSPADVVESSAAGQLLRLLPELQLPPLPLAALTPQRSAQPAKVRHAIAALRHHLDRTLPTP